MNDCCLLKVNVPIFGFVENMAYFQCGKCDEKTYIFGKDGCKNLAAEVTPLCVIDGVEKWEEMERR